ncbi:MAG: hypothetical protein IPM74_15110 [Crocinitomicaceae bacterium]|nr:hypothetical protein [Crocinitomicaceae bacterium]MBK8927200.1 hypothetical protein [Crocinitomicaceae bacterium]
MNKDSVHSKINQLPVSINDIRDKYFDDLPMTDDEKTALKNYDRYRMEYLNAAENEDVFEKRYLELQAKANLSPYTDFISLENLQF